MCMAKDRFDPETVRGLQCAQQNLQGPKPSYWGFAACYAGPKLLDKLRPNTEAVIALECAMTSGGEPVVFASCTGGQLAVRELDKCLQHGIGGKGCFGDNNFFVQAHRALDQTVADAVGKNSVAYQAWQAASSMTDLRGAPRSGGWITTSSKVAGPRPSWKRLPEPSRRPLPLGVWLAGGAG